MAKGSQTILSHWHKKWGLVTERLSESSTFVARGKFRIGFREAILTLALEVVDNIWQVFEAGSCVHSSPINSRRRQIPSTYATDRCDSSKEPANRSRSNEPENSSMMRCGGPGLFHQQRCQPFCHPSVAKDVKCAPCTKIKTHPICLGWVSHLYPLEPICVSCSEHLVGSETPQGRGTQRQCVPCLPSFSSFNRFWAFASSGSSSSTFR